MSFGEIALALTAVQAVSQISQGYAQKAESRYNASLAEGQANLINEQKQIESGQYDRLKGRTLATSVANVAGSGIGLSGSPLAVMLDTQTQINIDQAIGQFNLDQERNYRLAEAQSIRRQGSQAVRTGYSNAFSKILSGASNYAMYKGFGQKTSAGTIKDTTFDKAYPSGYGVYSYKKPRLPF